MTTPHTHSPTLLKPAKPVGIIGYGAYVPRYRLPAKEVARVWTGGKGGLPIKEKAVPGLDEDVITMSIEAARNAMKRARKASQATRSNTPRARAAARTSSVPRKSRWQSSTPRIPMSLTRLISGDAKIKSIPSTACASRASLLTSSTSPKPPHI